MSNKRKHEKPYTTVKKVEGLLFAKVELSDDPKQVDDALLRALLRLWDGLYRRNFPQSTVLIALIAPIVVLVDRALSNGGDLEQWHQQHIRSLGVCDGRIERFVQSFMKWHRGRENKNRLLTIAFAVLESDTAKVGALRRVEFIFSLLEAVSLGVESAILDFFDLMEDNPNFFPKVEKREVVEKLGKLLGSNLVIDEQDVLALAKKPVAWAKGSTAMEPSHIALKWDDALAPFVMLLARTYDGIGILAHDLGKAPQEQQLAWSCLECPETLIFEGLSIEQKVLFLDIVFNGKHTAEYAMFCIGRDCLGKLTSVELASKRFDSFFCVLCAIFCERKVWREGTSYQNILERALSHRPQETSTESDSSEKLLVGLRELKHLFHYLAIVGAHPKSSRHVVITTVHRCESIAPLIAEDDKARKEMNIALAKIARRWKGSSDILEHPHLMCEALKCDAAGLELAGILGRPFLQEMKENVLSRRIVNSGPMTLEFLSVLGACGATTQELVDIDKSLEDRREQQRHVELLP